MSIGRSFKLYKAMLQLASGAVRVRFTVRRQRCCTEQESPVLEPVQVGC